MTYPPLRGLIINAGHAKPDSDRHRPGMSIRQSRHDRPHGLSILAFHVIVDDSTMIEGYLLWKITE